MCAGARYPLARSGVSRGRAWRRCRQASSPSAPSRAMAHCCAQVRANTCCVRHQRDRLQRMCFHGSLLLLCVLRMPTAALCARVIEPFMHCCFRSAGDSSLVEEAPEGRFSQVSCGKVSSIAFMCAWLRPRARDWRARPLPGILRGRHTTACPAPCTHPLPARACRQYVAPRRRSARCDAGVSARRCVPQHGAPRAWHRIGGIVPHHGCVDHRHPLWPHALPRAWLLLAVQALRRPPAGRFVQVSVGTSGSACAVAADGSVSCWGVLAAGGVYVRPGSFVQVSAGHDVVLAVKADGALDMFGDSSRMWAARRPLDDARPVIEVSN